MKPTASLFRNPPRDWMDYATLVSGSEAGERPQEPSPVTVHVSPRCSIQGTDLTPERVRRIMRGEERV